MLLYVKIPRIKGFAIIALLLFIHIVILVNWFFIETVMNQSKLILSDFLYYQNKAKLEGILLLLEKNINNNKCEIAPTLTLLLMKQPNTWWQQHACHVKHDNMRIDYLVESLGKDPCAFVDKKQIAHYYRLTIRFYTKNFTKIFLQSILIKPDNAAITCLTKMRMVYQGRQSWYQFDEN